MLLKLAVILVILWILGLIVHIGGKLIHVVLVIAVILAIVHFLQNRKHV
jgi:hypothetical protein